MPGPSCSLQSFHFNCQLPISIFMQNFSFQLATSTNISNFPSQCGLWPLQCDPGGLDLGFDACVFNCFQGEWGLWLASDLAQALTVVPAGFSILVICSCSCNFSCAIAFVICLLLLSWLVSSPCWDTPLTSVAFPTIGLPCSSCGFLASLLGLSMMCHFSFVFTLDVLAVKHCSKAS